MNLAKSFTPFLFFCQKEAKEGKKDKDSDKEDDDAGKDTIPLMYHHS